MWDGRGEGASMMWNGCDSIGQEGMLCVLCVGWDVLAGCDQCMLKRDEVER